MFIDFFFQVKQAKIPATIREWLMLVEAMKKNLVMYNIDDFYYLSRGNLFQPLLGLLPFAPNRDSPQSGCRESAMAAMQLLGLG